MSYAGVDWQDQAACRGMDVNLFFPEPYASDDYQPGQGRAAKAICARCPVRGQCLSYALSLQRLHDRYYGIFGGMSADERMKRFPPLSRKVDALCPCLVA